MVTIDDSELTMTPVMMPGTGISVIPKTVIAVIMNTGNRLFVFQASSLSEAGTATRSMGRAVEARFVIPVLGRAGFRRRSEGQAQTQSGHKYQKRQNGTINDLHGDLLLIQLSLIHI